MSHSWQLLLVVSLGLASSVACFVAGVYFQHSHATRLLHKLVQRDPYACYISPKIYKAFCFFDTEDGTAHRVQRIMKYGFPGLDDVRFYSDFVLSYDRRNRVAHWVCEHLQKSNVQGLRGVGRGRANYRSDWSVPSNFRSTLADYRHSGFDRGHLAAAANHRDKQSHCNETFLLTNIAPQIGQGFNSGAWNKLEIYVRELAQHFGSVYVCTGPLFKPRPQGGDKWNVEYQMIGSNMVAVPTHFFKVIMLESKLPLGKPYMEAYVLPNATLPEKLELRQFLCDIREIEHYAGLDFFQGIRRSDIFGSNYPNESQVFRDFN
ncbi:endonuclease G, mitochondrial [Drosophila grimshawi]|uniref:Endonuclease n=1 Tax=Drosophila grimshawi TaxID=7222 RepID=B4JR02_DROGR|nr:endonuclease G, mitochondrial [Drosophila grimshawi]EDV99332.1 GH13792 [Drosophila grimshawi]